MIVLVYLGETRNKAVEGTWGWPSQSPPHLQPSLCELCVDTASGLLPLRRPHRTEERIPGWSQEPWALAFFLYLCFLFCGSCSVCSFPGRTSCYAITIATLPLYAKSLLSANFSIGSNILSSDILHTLLLHHIIVGYFPLVGGKSHQGRDITPVH